MQQFGKGRVVSKTYITRRGPEHFFRIFNGFGISEFILDQLYREGYTNVLFEYDGTQGPRNYQIRLTDFLRLSKVWVDYSKGKADRQYICSIDYMKESINASQVPALRGK